MQKGSYATSERMQELTKQNKQKTYYKNKVSQH